MFRKMEVQKFPTRQWLLISHPGDGKSTFSTQMRTPLLPVDADHRYAEVAALAEGEVYQLSENPADNINAERIADLLKANMAGSGVKTVIIDSLTSILTPLVVEAILDNDAGRNKNRVSAFKDKALAMRLLQDTITGWGVDVLWIAHLRTNLDSQATQRESTSISAVEIARLRRSLNMDLRIVREGNRRGIHVEWARRGRSGFTLWDAHPLWRGMPERIENAVYGGLTAEDQERIEEQKPTTFSGPEAAIAWGFEQGCFRDAVHCKNAYEEMKRLTPPQSAPDCWRMWVKEVQRRVAEVENPLAVEGDNLVIDDITGDLVEAAEPVFA